MNAFSGPIAPVYTNFGYGYSVNQPTSPMTLAMQQKIENSSGTHGMLSSGFISGQMTSASGTVSSSLDNEHGGPKQIDILKKRPFEDLIDESCDSDDYKLNFSNQAMAEEAPSSLAYSNSWCSSEIRSKGREEKSVELSFVIDDIKLLDVNMMESDMSDLSDFENIENMEFKPERASTPNTDQNGNDESSNPTFDTANDNKPGAEWPTKDDNEVRTNNKLILSHKIYINILSQLFCEYCKKIGKHPMVVKSHTMKDKKDRVLCPTLRLVECIICKADGDNAHEVTDCPVLMKNYFNMKQSEAPN